MPYQAYKLIHFLGIFSLLIAIALSAAHVLRGGTRADNPNRRLLGIVHGLASFLILLGGFGMLARLNIVQGGLPAWVWAKLVIWVLAGASLGLVYRGAGLAKAVLVGVPMLALIAAYFALYKPF
ncbi:MAG: hypothetical protein WEE89_15380 [Gemmatimonadota bacterium]